MKFGIFYELQLPKPWGPNDELNLYQNALNQVELADKLGYDYAWEVEHHFLEEYSHSSAPEVFLGAASQRTKRIRLGHGVIQLTTNNPHRVAEKVSTLDLLSGGRVELGMGEAAGPAELHPFNIRVRDKRERWEEAVKAIVPMFSKESWEFHGQYYDFPARNVIPKPFQKPHPPLWVACSNIATIGKAGEWGMGALGFTFVTPEAARAWVHKYYNNLLNNSKKLADYPSNPNVAMVSGFMCAATDEEAQAKAAGFWTYAADATQAEDFRTTKWADRTVLVMGGEGEGIRHGVRATCDLGVKIPIQTVESLNVSVASAILISAWAGQISRPPT